jgi:hypothetical protein
LSSPLQRSTGADHHRRRPVIPGLNIVQFGTAVRLLFLAAKMLNLKYSIDDQQFLAAVSEKSLRRLCQSHLKIIRSRFFLIVALLAPNPQIAGAGHSGRVLWSAMFRRCDKSNIDTGQPPLLGSERSIRRFE